ncbi:MAG: rRNA pseudouridine synthase [Oscillospiraceae bacterium]|nr:rRNA pseudouridine synthase [Oscillospiraceae bacterium]
MDRLQKIISAAGVCSRRQAEEFLRCGRVAVNGRTASLGDRADPEADRITLDGRPVAVPAKKLYLMLHKPRGVVTTLSDEKGRPTVAGLVSGCGGRVYPVGRLDMDSEGLLLLTSDGAFAQRLAHPSHGMEKEYHVVVSGALAGARERLAALTALEDGTPIVPARVSVEEQGGGKMVLSVTIRQGLNRQVRRMCALAGLRVERLVRVREGSLNLGGLPCGRWRFLEPEEREALLGQGPAGGGKIRNIGRKR